LSSPQETPTPSRFKDGSGDDLVREVLSLLQDTNVKISTATEKDLSSLLSKHAKASEGLRRGRDVTRATIKARDVKITELIYRVSTLEAELEAERAMVKHLQWKAQAEEQPSP
jgi:molybdopterin-binding protein